MLKLSRYRTIARQCSHVHFSQYCVVLFSIIFVIIICWCYCCVISFSIIFLSWFKCGDGATEIRAVLTKITMKWVYWSNNSNWGERFYSLRGLDRLFSTFFYDFCECSLLFGYNLRVSLFIFLVCSTTIGDSIRFHVMDNDLQ